MSGFRVVVGSLCMMLISLSSLAGTTSPDVAVAPAAVAGIRIQPDKAPDCTSLKAIVETVTRGCRNNDEKAVALYNFMNLTHYHLGYPVEQGGIAALKEINCYGWSLCGGLHTVESALWRELGWGWRYVGWSNPGHTTVEAEYDGRWHYVDIFLKFYAWMPDGKGGRTIAGQDDLKARSKELLTEGMIMDKNRNCVYAANNTFVMGPDGPNWQAPAFLSCGDPVSGIVLGVNNKSISGSAEAWMGINHATGRYSTEVSLSPGFALENSWDAKSNAWYWSTQINPPHHSCPGYKDTRNDPAYGLVLEPYINSKPARSYASGMLSFAPDFSAGAVLQSFAVTDNVRHVGKALVPAAPGAPGRVTFSLASPYILTEAGGEAVGADTVEVSADGGTTFSAVDVKDFSEKVRGHVAVLVRVTFKESLSALKVQAVFQNNPGALLYLSPGRNEVTVSVADPKSLGNNQLVVTYAYRLGSRSKSFGSLCESGREIARQHGAKWADVITVAQKRFAAKDLPAKMIIDCPTPKGQYPVYPRMVFLRREVVMPGGVVQPLPAGAEEAKIAAETELQTLPNPFLVGAQPPPSWAGAKSGVSASGAGFKGKAKTASDPDLSSPIGGRVAAGGAPVRSGEMITVPLTYGNYINNKGEVAVKGTLRWPKTSDKSGKVVAGVVIIKGDLKGLAGKSIAAARLVVPVTESHNNAPTKLGAVLLQTPFDGLKGFSVEGFPEVAGTCVIPQQTDPPYNPAKPFAIDVTGALVSAVKAGPPFNGFALRVVPDREVDNGYTVNCKVSPTDPVMLEVDLAGK